MDEKEVMAVERQFTANIYARRNLVIERGKGAIVWDKSGREYIDCMSAYGVAIVGHCHPKIVEAIKRQAETMYSCHNSIYTEARSEFLRKLMAITPPGLKRAFLSNSGTESVEAAIKMARRFTGKTDIVAFVEAFHGKTMGALSATWNPAIEPLSNLWCRVLGTFPTERQKRWLQQSTRRQPPLLWNQSKGKEVYGFHPRSFSRNSASFATRGTYF